MKTRSIWLLFFVCPIILSAQEQLGLRIENYSGINAVTLNPAANVESPFIWDVNLIGIGQFIENNYGYIRNTHLIEVLQNTENIHALIEYDSENDVPDETLVFDFYRNTRKRYVSTITEVRGPSFMVSLNSGHTFGLFTNVRTMVSMQGMPFTLGYYDYEERGLNDPFSVRPFQGAYMAWSEIGINYAYKINTYDGVVGIGANIKFLKGYEAGFARNATSTGVTKIEGDTIYLNHADIEYGFTNANTEDDGTDFSLESPGKGVAIDLGVNYFIDGDESVPYKLRLGFSLLDIGKIKFSGQAERHTIQRDDEVYFVPENLEDVQGFRDGIEQLSEEVLGDAQASFAGNEFSMWMPGAVSIQADYAAAPYLFVNGTLVQRLNYGKAGVLRNNLLAITPRFEQRWFGAMLPVVIYNWQDFRIGAALRLGFLTIGTDKLGAWSRQDEFTGMDFYVALKVNPFDLGFGGKKLKEKRGKRGGVMGCYDF